MVTPPRLQKTFQITHANRARSRHSAGAGAFRPIRGAAIAHKAGKDFAIRTAHAICPVTTRSADATMVFRAADPRGVDNILISFDF